MGDLPSVGCPPSDLSSRPSLAVRLSQFVLLAVGVYFCFGIALWAQTSTSQTGDENQSWSATTESQDGTANPTRTMKSHTQRGNHILDKESIQRRGADGSFETYLDTETETVQVDATTVRTTTRTFHQDANGVKTLVQVAEEEKRSLPGGDSNIVRTTSNVDFNGNLQLVQRQTEETKKTSKDAEETKTTLMLPNANGGLAPARMIQERRKRIANDTVESQQTTLLPDGSGNWRVDEIRQATTRQEGTKSSTEERISRADAEGNMGEVSRTVSKESKSTSGESHKTVETYSVDVPGVAPDGRLHLVERSTTDQRVSSTGQQTSEKQVEQSIPGDPGSGLRVTMLATDTAHTSSSGAQTTRTVQIRDANGSFGVVSVDTTKSDNLHVIQVRIAPSEKPK